MRVSGPESTTHLPGDHELDLGCRLLQGSGQPRGSKREGVTGPTGALVHGDRLDEVGELVVEGLLVGEVEVEFATDAGAPCQHGRAPGSEPYGQLSDPMSPLRCPAYRFRVGLDAPNLQRNLRQA